jgi:hypothetical protein
MLVKGFNLKVDLCLPYYAYVFSSTKFKLRAEQVQPGIEGGREEE